MATHINPGVYNRRLVIQRATDVNSESGGITRTWPQLALVFGRWKSKGGNFQELQVGGQARERAAGFYAIRMPPVTPDYQAGDRIVDTTQPASPSTWSIMNVDDTSGDRRELLLYVRDVVDPDRG